jgi:putative transposase
LDSQSVKGSATPGVRGYDAGKQINGRKRHLLVDTLGLLLIVRVTVASVQDRDAARLLLRNLPGHCKKLRKIWVDGGYSGRLVQWAGMLQILPDCRIASKRNAWLYFAA